MTALLASLTERVEAAADPEQAVAAAVQALADARPRWGWVGVYLLVGDELVLGPFVGPDSDHTRIPVGVGVCGTAVAEDRNVVVDDVTALDNYLACSVGTRSEIVVLVRHDGAVVGQIDVDSDDVAAFDADDEALLGDVARIIAPAVARLAARQATPADPRRAP